MWETGILTAKSLLLSMMVGNAPMDNHNVEETYCMALNIYYEARGEGWKGKHAVAQVVKNRVEHEKYPDTICGVITQARTWNGKVIRDMCQFAWYCDGRSDTPQLAYIQEPRKGKAIEPNIRDWQNSVMVAIQVTHYWSRDITNGATHYYNHNISTPSWSTVYPITIIVGNHTFLKRND